MFTCEQEANRAVITFYTDIAEVEREEGTIWTATAWTTTRPWADNLPSRIADGQEAWLDAVMQETYAQEDAAQTKALQDQFTAGLLDTVLDLDYRLTIIELIEE